MTVATFTPVIGFFAYRVTAVPSSPHRESEINGSTGYVASALQVI